MQKRNRDEVYKNTEDLYFIPIASSYIDDRVQILNSGDTFGVFNRSGDLQHLGNDVFGLYHSGTRFLQGFEMRLNHQRPLLLSSYIKDSNDILSVDLVNPDLYAGDEVSVPRGCLHIERSKFIKDNICYENISFHNYDDKPHAFEVSFSLIADFRDIFEVRGIERKNRGTILGQSGLDDNIVHLKYIGLDKIHRTTEIVFSKNYLELENDKVRFKFNLAGKEKQDLSIDIHFQVEERRPSNKVTFGEAELNVRQKTRDKSEQFAQIETSNEQFNNWINRSKADLISLIADTQYGQYPYAGVPWYNTAFGRDGLITAQQMLWMAPHIAKGVLIYAATLQAKDFDKFSDAEPGKIFHEVRNGEMANLGEIPFKLYYGTIDATPLFISLAGNYYNRTGDLETITQIWPNIKQALRWMDEYGDLDGDGFIEYIHKSEKGLTNQGWKDSADCVAYADGRLAEAPIALCEVQGYAFDARLQAAKLAKCFGEDEFAAELTAKAERLAQRFNESFWDEELKTFVMALDREKRPCRIKTSNPGHALFSGIVAKDRAEATAKTFFDSDMYTGWGVRTLSSKAPHYNPMSYHNGSVWPHDNSLIALGLNRYGFKKEVLTIVQGLFDASLNFSNQRLPELFCGFPRRDGEGPAHYPVACSPQAWAVASVFSCIQATLGIEIDAIERQIRFHQPCLPNYIDSLSIQGLQLGNEPCDIFVNRHKVDIGISVERKPQNWNVIVLK